MKTHTIHNDTYITLRTLQRAVGSIRVVAGMGRWACLVGLSAGLYGSELSIADLRIGLDIRPVDFDFEVSNDVGTLSGSDTFDTGFGISLRSQYSFNGAGTSGGFFIGGEAVASMHEYAGGNDYRTYGLRGLGGYAQSFGDNWTLMGFVYAGFGYGEFELGENAFFPAATVDGTVIDYGATVGVRYDVARHWALQGEIGYLLSEGDLSGSGLDVTIEEQGIAGFLGVTYRFGGLPKALE